MNYISKIMTSTVLGLFAGLAGVQPAFSDNLDVPAVQKKSISTKSPAVSAYVTVLETRLAPGADGLMTFDYAAALKAGDLSTITAYVDHLAGQSPSTMGDAQATAYWANLYNAVTLQVVLENYPVKSIRDIKSGVFTPGPWKRDLVEVEGEMLSLDNIEHDILRVKYASPYIHYMVNCASIGCPNVLPQLWVAETLEADRQEAATDFINSSRGARIKGDKLIVSSIYDWFEKDFGGNKKSVLAHLSDHAEGDLAEAIQSGIRIGGYDYNWSLNAPD